MATGSQTPTLNCVRCGRIPLEKTAVESGSAGKRMVLIKARRWREFLTKRSRICESLLIPKEEFERASGRRV